jgi:hypothetical protein
MVYPKIVFFHQTALPCKWVLVLRPQQRMQRTEKYKQIRNPRQFIRSSECERAERKLRCTFFTGHGTAFLRVQDRCCSDVEQSFAPATMSTPGSSFVDKPISSTISNDILNPNVPPAENNIPPFTAFWEKCLYGWLSGIVSISHRSICLGYLSVGGRINWRRRAQIKNPPINPPVDRQSRPNIPLVCTHGQLAYRLFHLPVAPLPSRLCISMGTDRLSR